MPMTHLHQLSVDGRRRNLINRDRRRNLPSVEVDLVPAEQSGPGLIAEVAPQMNLETIGINKRSIDPLTQGEWSLGIRGQSPTESAPVADAQQEIF